MPKPENLTFPILLLNATERERVELAVVSAKKTIKLARDERAQALPVLILELLEKAGLELTEIKSIAVCNKPGSLTGTRIGVTVANTLSWLQKLPIIELSAVALDDGIKEIYSNKTKPKAVAVVQNEVVYSPA